MKYQLLKVVRKIVNILCAEEADDGNPLEQKMQSIAYEIRNILIKYDINEN